MRASRTESPDLASSTDTGADSAAPADAWGPESSCPWVLTSGEGRSEEGRKEEEKGEQRKPEGQGSSREVRAGAQEEDGRKKKKIRTVEKGCCPFPVGCARLYSVIS